ncbi:hypothetical protein ABZ725_14680 [Streptomyces sp. NPDC006872]|uniref:hypothetical protein n=1 Tax=Streptomyces sp. NPDC006872 TaxID=3155720 RepID=UPI0034045105
MSFGQQPPPQPQWAPAPQPPVPPRPGWARKRIAIPAAGVLLLVGVGIGAAGGEDGSSKTATAKATVTVTATPAELAADEPAPEVTVTETVTSKPTKKAEPKVATIPGDGTFVVGTDIKAGTYKSAGPADSVIPNCYWARLKSTSGDFDDIITNNNASGPTTVTISASDGAFQTTGCKEWKKVS